MSRPPPPGDHVPYIAHDEFRNGLPQGHFHVVVDPRQARRYVVQRTRVDLLALWLIGTGALLALTGSPWGGGALVAAGIAANRLVRHQAGRILLHLAASDPVVYDEAATQGVMEVRRRG